MRALRHPTHIFFFLSFAVLRFFSLCFFGFSFHILYHYFCVRPGTVWCLWCCRRLHPSRFNCDCGCGIWIIPSTIWIYGAQAGPCVSVCVCVRVRKIVYIWRRVRHSAHRFHLSAIFSHRMFTIGPCRCIIFSRNCLHWFGYVCARGGTRCRMPPFYSIYLALSIMLNVQGDTCSSHTLSSHEYDSTFFFSFIVLLCNMCACVMGIFQYESLV